MRNKIIVAGVLSEEVILDIVKMEDELDEHRYYLEKKVAVRTEQLLTQISLLESCNEALCEKLAVANKELDVFRQQLDVEISSDSTYLQGRYFPALLMPDGVNRLMLCD
jgi:hypothetical protein